MSTSLRDQLLKAGLINQQQANEVERQQDRQHRQQTSRRGPAPQGRSGGPPARPVVPTPAAMPPQRPAKPVPRNEKALRDLKLNQQKAEKAEKRARAAQLRQLIEHHRLPPLEQGELYNFIDVDKVRCVRVDADRRARIVSGDLAIVRHAGLYAVVPASVLPRIRERDEHAIVTAATAAVTASAAPVAAPADDPYAAFQVPDDLVW
jgi:uncharacterized protein YaiL (DUF2058 family)